MSDGEKIRWQIGVQLTLRETELGYFRFTYDRSGAAVTISSQMQDRQQPGWPYKAPPEGFIQASREGRANLVTNMDGMKQWNIQVPTVEMVRAVSV